MLYLRFTVCLAVGLTGLAVVLSTLMDTLLNEWDIHADIKRLVDEISKDRKKVAYAQMEPQRVEHLSTRLEPNSKSKAMEKQFLAGGSPGYQEPIGRPAEPYPQLVSLS